MLSSKVDWQLPQGDTAIGYEEVVYIIYPRRPVVCFPFPKNHKRDRRLWAEEHEDWQLKYWESVLFSDKSWYGERFKSEIFEFVFVAFVREHPEYESGTYLPTLIVSAESLGRHTNLHLVDDDALTAARHRNEIIEPTVGNRIILMDDNIRPYLPWLIDKCFLDIRIGSIEWPTCSEDLNPFKHLWNVLQLRIVLIEEWNRLPQDFINILIHSMLPRCTTFLAVRGRALKCESVFEIFPPCLLR